MDKILAMNLLMVSIEACQWSQYGNYNEKLCVEETFDIRLFEGETANGLK